MAARQIQQARSTISRENRGLNSVSEARSLAHLMSLTNRFLYCAKVLEINKTDRHAMSQIFH